MSQYTAAIVLIVIGTAALAHEPEGAGLWKAADADGDGAVTRQEFDAAREALFARLDHNADGVVDAADRPPQGEGERQPRLARMHARLDADKDGKLTREEFVQGGAPMFERIDANHDGAADQTEIAAARREMREQRLPPANLDPRDEKMTH